MPKLAVERIAEIRITIKAETKKRNTILADLHDELKEYAKANPKGPIKDSEYGYTSVKEDKKNSCIYLK